ncbi:hypothetical protein J2847_000941 [Azospirillum agricola]|uniref:hypothetical protein n=1 Tax=Azospirillum agricola TaxID=1720247 RepID=UPI001AE59455|nr:hypothetical protein [Azospirillum agricola]MBP2227659.1 hypothetical protein [Azospirillum agricola]
MKLYAILPLLALTGVATLLPGLARADELLVSGRNAGVEVVAAGDPWCARVVRVQLRLNPKSQLVGNVALQQRVVQNLGPRIEADCPVAESLRAEATDQRGAPLPGAAALTAQRSGGWAPVVGPAPPPAAAPSTAAPAAAAAPAAVPTPPPSAPRPAAPDPGPAPSAPQAAVAAPPPVAAPADPAPVTSFGLDFWLEIGFALLLGGLALGLHLVSTSQTADAFLDQPQALRSLREVLFSQRGKASDDGRNLVFISGDEMSQEFKIALKRGVFLHDGNMRRCWMAHVPVPPGAIARVGAAAVSGSRILDTSRLITLLDENLGAELTVSVIERGARWQVPLQSPLETRDGYRVRLHLAVHSWVPVPADDPRLGKLFENYRHYRRQVGTWGLEALQTIFSTRTYDEIMRNGDETLEQINRRWLSEKRRLLPDLDGVVETQFTGLVVKPRQEAEETRFTRIFNKISSMERILDQRVLESKVLLDRLTDRTVQAISRIDAAMAALDGPVVKGSDGTSGKQPSFAEGMVANTRHIAGTMTQSRDGDALVRLVRTPFQTARTTFEQAADEYIAACADLATVVRGVRQEQTRSVAKEKAAASKAEEFA